MRSRSSAAGPRPVGGDRPEDVFLAAARDLGDRLAARAVWDADRCAWTADQLDTAGDGQLVHASVDSSLYSGTTGIARFLAYLWQVTGTETYRETALGALASSWANAEVRPQGAGLFTGPLGTAVVTAETGGILERGDLMSRGLEIGRRALEEITRPGGLTTFDLIEGAAGALVGSAFLADADGSYADACKVVGRNLVAAGRRFPWGTSWADASTDGPALCGLAHGAAGAALGLFEAWRVTGDAGLLEAAREAMRFEQAWFNSNRGLWPDNREAVDPGAPGFSAPFWCHGAAGIGLARLRGYELTRDRSMVAEAGAALHSASVALQWLQQGGPSANEAAIDGNFSVCHGVGSLIELHTYAAETLAQPVFLESARRAMCAVLDAVRRSGGRWRCGVPGGDEHPGLMLGLSGIGMCLLRLHAPGTVRPASLFGQGNRHG